MKKIPISIVTPAYHEVNNLENLLTSIHNQNQTNFILKEIIIASDGGSDGTDALILELQHQYPLLKSIIGRKRKGKGFRLNQLYQAATGKLIVQVDADVIFASPDSINALIKKFDQTDVVLVSGNNQPLKGKNFIQEIMNLLFEIWYYIRADFKNGDNIHNFHGSIGALETNFSRGVPYPPGVCADHHYLFLRARQVGKFKFATKADINFWSPNNLSDFYLQAYRSLKDREESARYFSPENLNEFDITLSQKLKGIWIAFVNHPILTSFGLFFMITLRLKDLYSNQEIDGFWEPTSSTKEAIHQ